MIWLKKKRKPKPRGEGLTCPKTLNNQEITSMFSVADTPYEATCVSPGMCGAALLRNPRPQNGCHVTRSLLILKVLEPLRLGIEAYGFPTTEASFSYMFVSRPNTSPFLPFFLSFSLSLSIHFSFSHRYTKHREAGRQSTNLHQTQTDKQIDRNPHQTYRQTIRQTRATPATSDIQIKLHQQSRQTAQVSPDIQTDSQTSGRQTHTLQTVLGPGGS